MFVFQKVPFEQDRIQSVTIIVQRTEKEMKHMEQMEISTSQYKNLSSIFSSQPTGYNKKSKIFLVKNF